MTIYFQIERIVALVLERFPGTDMNEVRSRMNQKCRDSAPKIKPPCDLNSRNGEIGGQNGEGGGHNEDADNLNRVSSDSK